MSPCFRAITTATLAVVAVVHAAPANLDHEAARAVRSPTPTHGPRRTRPARLDDSGSDSDYAGAYYQGADSQSFTAVTATFAIPSASVPTDQSSSNDYYFSLWAGIQGGYNANEGLLQTGCDIDVDSGSSSQYNQCWFEYYPADSVYLNMYPQPGDQIAVGVQALNATAGIVVIENLNDGTSFTSTMAAPAADNTILGGANVAEFALETTPTPTIPAFQPIVTFTNANIYDQDGNEVPIASNSGSDVQLDGSNETQTTISDNTVEIQYVQS